MENQAWGDHLELQALAQVLRSRIVVLPWGRPLPGSGCNCDPSARKWVALQLPPLLSLTEAQVGWGRAAA